MLVRIKLCPSCASSVTLFACKVISPQGRAGSDLMRYPNTAYLEKPCARDLSPSAMRSWTTRYQANASLEPSRCPAFGPRREGLANTGLAFETIALPIGAHLSGSSNPAGMGNLGDVSYDCEPDVGGPITFRTSLRIECQASWLL